MGKILFVGGMLFGLTVGMLAGCQSGQQEEATWNEGDYAGDEREAFIDRIMNDTTTLSMDLTSEADWLDIRIAESPDKRLRVYSWISGGGTSPEWTCYTQYRDSQGKVKTYEGVPIPEEENYGTITQILQADNLGDKTLYLVLSYGKASSVDGYEALVPVFLDADTFALGPKFCYEGGAMFNTAEINYNIPDWYFRANNGEGWDWQFDYIPEDKEVWVAWVDDYSRITDRYEVFKYDGKNFITKGIRGPRRLHPSVREFEFLEAVYDTEQHIVRVDQMSDASFRLTLWTNPSVASTSSIPDLIIPKGKYDEDEGCYVFRMGRWLFSVPDANNGTAMRVYNENRLLFTDRKRTCSPWLRQNVADGIRRATDGMEGDFNPKLLYVMDNHIVLVDSIAQEGYRYVSWKISENFVDIGEKPALELRQGMVTSTYYRFKNGDYVYWVPKNDIDVFLVTHKDKKISREQVKWSYAPVVIKQLLEDNF